MFNANLFNLKKTEIYRAVKWAKHPAFRFAKPLKKLFLFLFILFFLLFLYAFLTEQFSKSSQSLALGFSTISLTLFLFFRLEDDFLNSKLKKPALKPIIKEAAVWPADFNLAEFLSFKSAQTLSEALKFAKSKKFPEVNSSVLFYALLKNNPNLNFIFSRAVLNTNEINKILRAHFKAAKKEKTRDIYYSNDFQEVILAALKTAPKRGHQRIETGDILISLAKHDLIFKKILIDSKLKVQDIENLTWWLESLEKEIVERKKFWERKNLLKKGSVGKELAAGYTVTLDKFSTDLSETLRKEGFPEIVGRSKEIKVMERILARREINNCLLVGEPGVGRKRVVMDLARKSVLGESLPEVNYKRVVQLDLPALLARTESSSEVENILDRIFQETIRAGNIILVIDEFHNFIGGKERPGVIDISGVVGSYLHLPQFQIVAVTTYSGLHKYIEEKPSILALFEKVELSEVSEDETLMILEKLALYLEAKYKIFVTFPALKEIISLTEKYVSDKPLPKSATDLLDEAMVYVSSQRGKILFPEHIAEIISEKTEIPVGEIEAKEKETLLNLEKLLHQRIINQNEAVDEISASLRRARAEVTVRKGPMGCFLFLGPTGVGKTETAKALAEIYFGSEQRIIRIDMSEFQSVSDIPRLIGSSGEEGFLTTQVRETPFSLILLDEIEKAHSNILNLFLQVLDEGYLTDGLGRKVDFKNSIIIATSNAGYQIILQALKEKREWPSIKPKLLDYLFEKAIFRPEFINRFDAVVVFSPLSKENLLDIAELMLQKLKKSLKEKGIDFVITGPLKEKIVELGYDPTFGARQMRRVIQDKVENILASALLSGELKRGDRIEIDPEQFELKIK